MTYRCDVHGILGGDDWCQECKKSLKCDCNTRKTDKVPITFACFEWNLDVKVEYCPCCGFVFDVCEFG